MQESRSAKDVEQLLGRVLRMPYAKARKHPVLNQAYAHITARSFGEALHSIQDNLVNNMDFDPMDAALALQSQPAGNNSLFNDESDGSGGTAPSQPSMSVPLPVMPQTPVPAELQDKIEIRPTQSGSTVLIHGEMTQEVEDFILTGVPKKRKRPAKAVLTGATGYSAGRATRQGSSSPTRFTGQSAITFSTCRR